MRELSLLKQLPGLVEAAAYGNGVRRRWNLVLDEGSIPNAMTGTAGLPSKKSYRENLQTTTPHRSDCCIVAVA